MKAGLKGLRNKDWFTDSFGRPVENSWHHRRWLSLAERHRFLLIEAAREHAKTQLFAITDPLFEIKDNRNIRILLISDVFEKSSERARVLREHIQANEAYRRTGKPVEIIRKNGDYEFTVKRDRILKEPTVRSTYAGGPISGGRYDRIICDDLVNWRLNSTTTDKRDKLRRWWHDEVMNSVAEGGRIVVIGTRQHHEDLYETVKADPRFYSETFPALDEQDVLGYRAHNEAMGHAGDDALCLWPAAWPYDALAQKREADEDSFMRQQQQVAMPDTGLVYRRPLVDAALERGKAVEYDPDAAQYLGLDPGYGKRAALLAIQERTGDRVEMWREHSFTQMDDDAISSVVVEHCADYGVETVYIDAEDPGLAAAITRDLRASGVASKVKRVPFNRWKKPAIKATRWLLGVGKLSWRAEETIVHMPGKRTIEPSIFRSEVRDYALKSGSDDEPQKEADHGPDAHTAYMASWVRAWANATGNESERDA